MLYTRLDVAHDNVRHARTLTIQTAMTRYRLLNLIILVLVIVCRQNSLAYGRQKTKHAAARARSP